MYYLIKPHHIALFVLYMFCLVICLGFAAYQIGLHTSTSASPNNIRLTVEY